MALSWGAWRYGGGNGMRVGIDPRHSAVSTSSTTVTFYFDVWTGNQYNYRDDQTLTYGYAVTGTDNYYNGQNSGTSTKRFTKTWVYTYPAGSYGSSPGAQNMTARVGGAYNGVTPEHGVTVTIPARPYAAPNVPGVPVVARNSDTQATITWTLSTTAQRPVTSSTVEMQTYSGSTWTAWTSAGTVSGTTKTLVKTGLQANRVYRFRVRANNAAGSSAFTAQSNYAYMTPAAPTGAAASLVADGSQALLEWTDPSYLSGNSTHEIERRHNDGEWESVATAVPQGTTWLDESPPAGSVQYRIRTANSSLASAWAETNTLSTIAPPLAPTGLAPDDTVVDVAPDVVLAWQHNHGGDGAPQSAAVIDTSSDNGETWVERFSGPLAEHSWTMPGGTLANGGTVLWRVKTQGVVSEGFGPYSASASFVSSSTPIVAIAAPVGEVNSTPIDVEWTYSQDEGKPQTQYEVRITDADGNLLQGTSGTGTGLRWLADWPFQDGGAYAAHVRSRSSAGLWSAWAVSEFTVEFLPPAAVDMAGEYDECTGVVRLLLVGNDHEEGVTSPIVSVNLYRRIDGADWQLLVGNLGIVPGNPFGITDPLPSTARLNEYGLVVYSTDSSAGIVSLTAVPGTDGTGESPHWVFFSWGSDFTDALRFQGEPSVSATTSRTRGAEFFAGRSKPFLLLGEHVDRSISVSGTVYDPRRDCFARGCQGDSDHRAWEEMSQQAVVVCYRDWKGRRLFGRLESLSIDYGEGPIFGISTGLQEIEYRETAGTLTIPEPTVPRATAGTVHAPTAAAVPDHTSSRQERLDWLDGVGVATVGALGDEELLDLIRDLLDMP